MASWFKFMSWRIKDRKKCLPSSLRSSTNLWSFVKFPHALNIVTIIPLPKTFSLTRLNDNRPITLASVVMKSLKQLLLKHLKNISGPLLNCLQWQVQSRIYAGLWSGKWHLKSTECYSTIPARSQVLRVRIMTQLLFHHVAGHCSLRTT